MGTSCRQFSLNKQEMEIIKAVLVTDIEYKKDGKKIEVKAGTEIIVDLTRNIALIGDDHVDIFFTEYQMIRNE